MGAPKAEGAKGDCVEMMELVEFVRVGEAGRPETAAEADWVAVASAGGGLEGVRWRDRPGNGDGGQTAEVGVGMGVFWEEREMGCGVGTSGFVVDESGVYGSPSSEGEKVRVEQKPSEEVMRRVRPSLDLSRLV